MKIVRAEEFNMKRHAEYGTDEQHRSVKQIIETVARDRDEALRKYSEQFDGVRQTSFRIDPSVMKQAYEQVEPQFVESLRKAADNIRKFHEKQKRNSWFDLDQDGTMLGMMLTPLRRVGFYVPGGTAAYPSSVLMNIIPAQVAGVKEIVMVTPPATAGKEGIHPAILVAADLAGVTELYGIGGAHAIAALSYGTESIAAVDKICGPGNIYVALAKRYVYGIVDIDSIAGPTDITILADAGANPAYVAADLLSQAEHDELASAILVTDSAELAENVKQELARQLESLPRKSIASASLEQNGAIILVDDLNEGIELVNQIAPEHLEIQVQEPMDWLHKVRNAGAIFLGPYSTEPVGDYFAGPNHILPTGGTARYSSPLNVDDFYKKMSVIRYSRQALMKNGPDIMRLARLEELEGHARAVQIRLETEHLSE